MDTASAIRLLEGAVDGTGGTWADLGCGDGTFTAALAERLGSGARVFAVDHDPSALSRLRQRFRSNPGIIPVEGDFTGSPGLLGEPVTLDGILFANSLHYVRKPEDVLARWASRLRPDGRAVFVEYDRRDANPWVPYPISPRKLATIAASAGLSAPVVTATAPSAFRGSLYVAYSVRRDPRHTGTIG